MKILHIINNLKREGAQMVVFNLVTVANACATDHIVYIRVTNGPLKQHMTAAGVAVFSAAHDRGVLGTRKSVAEITAIIEREKVDLIHAHMADAAFLGCLAAWRRKKPLVISHHGHDVLPDCGFLCRRFYQLALAMASRFAQRNIAVAPSVAKRAQSSLALARDRIEVISNGVAIPADRPVRGPNACPVDAPVLVSVGRLVDLKGQNQLIDAAGILRRRFPNLRVYILGDGPREAQLREQIRSLELSDHIELPGSVGNVSAYLNKAHVCVSTSRVEGMPVSILEAMAHGTPVVASDVPGNRGVVRHEETGLLYPVNDIEALAASITEVLEGPETAAARAAAARRMVETNYSVAAMRTAHEDLYRQVLGQPILPVTAQAEASEQ